MTDQEGKPYRANGWGEWARHVLQELERFETDRKQQDEKVEKIQKELDEKIDKNKDETNRRFSDLEIKVARLEVKAGVWGIVGSLVGFLIYLIVNMVKNGQIQI